MLGLLAQIKTFFLTMVLGMAAGMIFQYYQLTIRALRAGKYSLYLLDLLLWILMILLISVGMLLINQGELRIYFFLILIGGSWLYFKFLAGAMKKPLGILAEATQRIISFIGNGVVKPVKWLLQRLRSWRERIHSAPPPDDISE